MVLLHIKLNSKLNAAGSTLCFRVITQYNSVRMVHIVLKFGIWFHFITYIILTFETVSLYLSIP